MKNYFHMLMCCLTMDPLQLICMKEQYESAIRKAKKLQQSIQELHEEQEHVGQLTLDTTPNIKDERLTTTSDSISEINSQPNVEISADKQKSEENIEGSTVIDPLTSLRMRAASILHEIDSIKESNQSLRQRADELHFALICISDNMVSEASICKQLEQAVRQRQGRCRELSEKYEKLERTFATYLEERCKLLDTNQTNSSDEIKAIMEQMKSLEQELSSTREERDHLQTTLDEKKAKMELERASVSEMKVLADARQVCF